ncbi:hypothetical protein GCM10018790_77980 [Kitasatospora xanthocidica]|uniref:MobF family relaxase n=1 Tax=Kitasatospora xanthocidica TaxID=83382 RepID=UPI0016726655|nr:MobF family relaxase [Kitasatospora xanthocidica]GHF89005.1 hypothetical protein GCM10018790_77980 [Kitasatospora xanthocidica]
MMTVHRLSAGDGYAYYLRETVSADAPRRGGELGDYYTAEGQPPGLWTGSGTALLEVTGTVTEAQMRALFGEGLHPNAQGVIAARIADGATAKQALAAVKLGRAYPRYKEPDDEFRRELDEEVEAFNRRRLRPPDAREHAALRGKAGVRLFVRRYGRRPATTEELGRFVKAAEAGRRQSAVAGFDLVFSAAKSVSVLWALGDAEVRRAVERAHERAIDDTLAWLEAEATMTRTGTGGVAQEHVDGGLIATRFRHYENRLGEPMLHDHVVVANKVRGRDGRWRSLDSALLYAQAVAASELYNARVVEEVCAALGLRAEAREVSAGKRPVMEIAGVGTDLIEGHSRRSMGIKERVAELVRDFRETHGREPSAKTLTALMQRATLDTRPDKERARSLFDLRTEWREAAVRTFGAERVDGLLRGARQAAEGFREDSASLRIDVETAAREVVETVSEHRSVWGRRQVLAEARRWVMNATRGTRPGTALAEEIAAHALAAHCLDLTPPDPSPRFAPLTRDDGESVYRRREARLYTSAAVLSAEDRIVAAARTPVIPAVPAAVYARVEAAYREAHPDRPLDAGQRALARAFATGEHLVHAAIGPAGAGKTTAMALAADAVRAAGGRVIGLGPSARAAAELSAGIGAPAYVLHEWLARRDGAHDGGPVDPGFELYPGDLVIVDEAGMAGSRRLAAVIADAQRAGALVRLVGDPAQLASVESGGALRLLAGTADVVELESVHRFRVPGEAAASLALRGGEPEDAWTWYLDRGRVVAGSREQMLHQVFADWQRDTEAGLTAMMMADDNATVDELNSMAQAHRLATGRLDTTRAARLRDGGRAHGGDLVVTRRNARKNVVRGGKDFVKNGDQWSVVTVQDDGSLVVRHTGHGGRATLPADYVARSVDLGYAGTAHRGQGATVDTGSGLFTERTARESAYVAMTRGRQENRAYLVLDDGRTIADVLHAIARNTQASRSATDTVREEWDRAWGIRQLANEYTDVHARALSLRYENMLRGVLGDAAETFITADAWPAVVRAVRDAERAGFAPERILRAAHDERDFRDAEDVSAVLSWRVDNHVEDARDTLRKLREQNPRRPLADLTAAQLDTLAERAAERRAHALEELHRADARVANQPRRVTVDGREVQAWPRRVYGDRTRARLAEEIAWTRRYARALGRTDPDSAVAREAYETLSSLLGEQRLRARMAPLDRMREIWQREPGTGHAATAGQEGVIVSATMRVNVEAQEEARRRVERTDVVIARIRAEQRLRRLLPDSPPPVPDHSGPVPEWLAERTVERDRHTPPAWVDHLRERREVIEAALRRTGRALALAPPAWARVLGPVPPPDHDLREAWERAAALADAWRTRRGVRDAEPGIGGRPDDERDARAWQALHDEVAEVGRRARAVESAGRRGEALYPEAGPDPRLDSLGPAVADETRVAGAADPPLDAADAGSSDARGLAAADDATPDLPDDAPVEEATPRAVEPSAWQDLPYATLSDAQLTDAMAHAADAAESAYRQATAQDAEAAALAAALDPGGEVEQQVTRRAERVAAILRMRRAADLIQALEAGAGDADQEASGIEERLAETALFGRPAVRGADRDTLRRQLTAVREARAERARRLEDARQQIVQAIAQAGDPAEHERLLENWRQAGGTRDTVLERTKASRRRGLRAAWDEAKATWERWEALQASTTAIRQEMNRRDAQPHSERAVEEAWRIQAAQQRAADRQRPQGGQQQDPDSYRSRRGLGGPGL